jgi:hypothetical protein
MTRKLCNVLIINVAFAQNNYQCYIHTTIITSSLICYVIVNINLVKKMHITFGSQVLMT